MTSKNSTSNASTTREWRCEACQTAQPMYGRAATILSLSDRSTKDCPTCGKKTKHTVCTIGRPSTVQDPDQPAAAQPETPPAAPATPPAQPETTVPTPEQETDMSKTTTHKKTPTPRQPSVVDQAAAAAAGTPCMACKGSGQASKGGDCFPCNGTGTVQPAGAAVAAATQAAPRAAKPVKPAATSRPRPAAQPATPAPAAAPAPKSRKPKTVASQPAPAPAAPPQATGLTRKETEILTALSNGDMGRKALEAIGASSKILGAATKEGGGAQGGGLEGKGYIKSMRVEGERQLWYSITAAGRKALKS